MTPDIKTANRQFDIIADIHGDHDRMTGLLGELGYDLDSHTHPDGHMAIFLGDFIDRGNENLRVLRRLKSMLDAGSAIGLLGNHEVNMLLYHTDGPHGDGLRKRTEQNRHQHSAFLDECPLGSAAAAEARAIVHELRLVADLGAFRVAHAFWSDAAVSVFRARRPDLRIAPADLEEISAEHDGTAFASAVAMICKGPELELPEGRFFLDDHGHRREKCRLRWWAPADRLDEAVAGVPDLSMIGDGPVPASAAAYFYDEAAPPVFFGHYQLKGGPQIGRNFICLDVPEKPLAYSWRGEMDLTPENIRETGVSCAPVPA